MRGRRTSRVRLIALSLVASALGLTAVAQKSQQSPDVLFESAKQKELVDGKLEEAIRIYQRVVQEHGSNRALAAAALLRIGQCYERLGQVEARQAYERLLRDFGDQAQSVAEARARLSALSERGTAARPQMAVRQIWAGPMADTTGAPSSDGRLLSATDWQTGDVAVFDVATQQMRRLTKTGDVMKSGEHALFAAFSPDDTLIAYAWFDSKRSNFELRVVNADGTGDRTLARRDGGWVLPLGWAPDGKQVAAIVDTRNTASGKQIVLVSVADGRVHVLKSGITGPLPDDITVSPDGRFVAYDVRETNGRRDIRLIRIQDGEESRLVTHPADDGAPIWTPDGRRILFASDRTGTTGLWVIEVANGKAVGVPELVKPDIGPGFGAMGFTKKGSLFYGLTTGMTDVYVGTIDVAAMRLVEAPAAISQIGVGANRLPAWSPDGRQLAYVSRRGPTTSPGGATVTVRTVSSGEERDFQITASTIRRIGWFPDGNAIVVTGLNEQLKPAIFRLDLKTAAFTTLVPVEHNLAVVPAPITPDGRTILYLAADVIGGSRTVISRDLATGQEKTVAGASLGMITTFALSRDGRQMAIAIVDAAKHTSGVAVMPVAGGQPREVCRFDNPNGLPVAADLVWSPDDRELLIRARPDGQLLAVAVEGGPMRQMVLPMEGVSGLSLHPDGKHVAFAAGQSQSEVWVIENFLPPLTKKLPTTPTPR
jgi:Tol biopolymer transport system component